MPEPIKTKRCSGCKEIKPTSEFSKDRKRPDGLQCSCKECQNAYLKSRQGTEGRTAAQKRYNESEKGKICSKKYRQTDKGKRTKAEYLKNRPEYKAARQAVAMEVRAGRMPSIGSEKCNCGNQAAAYHHHKGYSKENWLTVIPVCLDCHNTIHKVTCV